MTGTDIREASSGGGGGDPQPVGTRIPISPLFGETASVGVWTYAPGSYIGGGWRIDNSVDGNWIEWATYLVAGTWQVQTVYAESNGTGKFTPSISGVNGVPVDTYSAGFVPNQVDAQSIVVAASGLTAIRHTVTGKNAASPTYNVAIQEIVLVRIA